MRVTAIKRQRKRPERVNVYVDGEFRFAAAAEVILRSGLERGSTLTEEELRSLEGADAAWKAREAALHLLAHRDRSEGELRQRLIAREHPPAAVADALERLRDAGLLNDARFARAYAKDRLRARPTGRTRLLADLRARGLAPDLAEAAADEALRDTSESEEELIRRALRRFRTRAGEPALKRRRRAYAFLARRGFSGEAIANALADPEFDES